MEFGLFIHDLLWATSLSPLSDKLQREMLLLRADHRNERIVSRRQVCRIQHYPSVSGGLLSVQHYPYLAAQSIIESYRYPLSFHQGECDGDRFAEGIRVCL